MSAPERIFARLDTATVYMDGSSPLVARTREFRGGVEYVRADIVDEMADVLRVIKSIPNVLPLDADIAVCDALNRFEAQP